MAKNWLAYEAAEALYGNNVDDIKDVGSRYPLFTRTISMLNSEYVIDILKAIPKVTARVVETGLNGIEPEEEKDENAESETKEVKKPAKTKAKTSTKKVNKKEEPEEEESDDDITDYETMTAQALYKLCCKRGISGQCKSRSKSALIAVLEANDGKSEPDDNDDWDDEEEEKESDPYEGKSAKELYKMCTDRGIKATMKQSADAYVKLLKKADEAESDDTEEDDDEDWEI